MRITDIKFEKLTVNFNEVIKVTFATIGSCDNLLIKIETDEGIMGYGEAAPLGFVTGDNFDTVMAIGKCYREALIGENPLCLERIHFIMDRLYDHNTAIKAGFDIALHDIAAKKMGQPLYQYLGGYRDSVVSDVTVGIDEAEVMAKKCLDWAKKGFRELKIKLGNDIAGDIERIRMIREAVGEKPIIRVDANQGWSVKDAIKIIKAFEPYNINLIEQPVAYWDYDGLYEIKSSVDTPIVADESCHSPVDAAKLAKARAVDGVNIKLMKSCGIHKARKINAIAEANGLFCMIGCMGESRLANVAAFHMAAATKNIVCADVDSLFSIENETIRGGVIIDKDVISFTDKPGLGVTIDGM